MRTSLPNSQGAPLAAATLPRSGAATARLADYLILTKPRIALLALVTVCAGYALGSENVWRAVPLTHALVGIVLVAAGSSALNQYLERDSDALMRRTANRPLPAGRLAPVEVLLFGWGTGVAGVLYLAAFVNLATALLSALTLLLYAGIYTPLKRHSGLATAVGAIPGALPPVLGWVASGAPLNAAAFSLFAVLFLWQFPHFLAIGWIYREEYARAGLRMLPARGAMPRIVGLAAVCYALVLVPLSVYPATCGLAGSVYSVVALILSLGYLAAAIRFAWTESRATARGLLYASLIYLPVLLLMLVWDHFRLLA
ncbi:MAG: heme o synthase [Planctomycetales bacterium]